MAKNKEEQNKSKHDPGKRRPMLFPRKPAYVILLLVMGLVAAGLMGAMVMVNTFPPDLTMIILITMAALFILAGVMMARHKKWKRIVGIIVAALFIIVFGSATYYLGSTYAMMTSISSDSEFSNAGGVRSNIDPAENPFNIYLTGIDQWEAEKGEDLERSDVNMIITVNPQTKKVLLTSIPRDSYVKLHTAQQMDKLTHTGIYGVDETLNTVEDWLGIDLSYYIKMNFSGARDIINAIGGIKVYSPVEFDSSLAGYHYVKGWNRLSGREALYFARERKAFEGQDSVRVENQQRVVEAIIKRVTASPALLTNYGEVMAACENNLHTDMSYSEIRDLVKMQLSDLSTWDIESQKIEGEYDEDYVASLTQSMKFQIYRPSEESVSKCVNAINDVLNPTEEELAAATAERRKGFISNVVKLMTERVKKED